MHDDWLDDELHRSLKRGSGHSVPDFASVMQAAEGRNASSRMRYRLVAACAAIVSIAVVTIAQWPNGGEVVEDEFMIAVAMLETTQWTAPSDALLPQHQFDIYRDMPVFLGSTEAEEGTLQ